MIDQMAEFKSIQRTKIGSPYVIAAMEAARASSPDVRIVGYEANGGLLLGFNADGPAGSIAPLMTRDSLLPIIAPLAAARAQNKTLTQLAAALPACFTASDRVQNIPTDTSAAFIATLTENADVRVAFFDNVGAEISTDLTDGLRVTFDCETIVHLRPSGNAPECRCYVEASSQDQAVTLVQTHLAKLRTKLS